MVWGRLPLVFFPTAMLHWLQGFSTLLRENLLMILIITVPNSHVHYKQTGRTLQLEILCKFQWKKREQKIEWWGLCVNYCCPIGWLVSTVNLTGARVVDKTHFWAHLWGVVYIRLIEMEKSTLNIHDTILLAAGKGEGSCCSQSSSLPASWCRYCVNSCSMLCRDSLAMMSCSPLGLTQILLPPSYSLLVRNKETNKYTLF